MNAMTFSIRQSVLGLVSKRKTQTRRIAAKVMVSVRDPVWSDSTPRVCAPRGVYAAKLNAHGAVTITVDVSVTDGRARPIKPFDLGLKPGEFDFIVPQLGADASRALTHLANRGTKHPKCWVITPPPGKIVYVRESIERDGDRGVFVADRAPAPIDTWTWKRDRLSAMFMPFGARRFELALGAIKLEHLQSISEDDSAAEGADIDDEECDHTRHLCHEIGCLGQTYKSGFCKLWCSHHGMQSWDANPWVFAFTFAARNILED